MQDPLLKTPSAKIPSKPLLYSTINLHYPQTFKRFKIKNQKLHRIEKINTSLFEKPSFYNSLHFKHFLSSQKRLSYLYFFPLDISFQKFVPPSIFKNVQELKHMTLTPSSQKTRCVKPNPMKKLRTITAYIDLRKSSKFTCSFYSRSASQLNIGAAINHDHDLLKTISPLYNKFPETRSLRLQFTSSQANSKDSNCNDLDFTQKFWKTMSRFKRLQILSIMTKTNSSYNSLIQLLPEENPKITIEINLQAVLFDTWTPSQIDNFAHHLNYLKKCIVSITFKWYAISMTLMKKILSFLDKINHQVSFWAQEEFTVSMNKTWIYELLDQLSLRPQKILAWNAIAPADALDMEKVKTILSCKDTLDNIKIECWNWIQNYGSEDRLAIFKALGEFTNLKNLSIRLSIEPGYYDKDWKLDGLIDVVQGIVKGIEKYKGDFKLIIKYKDDGEAREGMNEEKMGRIWRLMEGLSGKVRSMMVIMDVWKGFRVEEMTKEMFEVLKGYKRMEYLEFESNFELEDLEIIKKKMKEICGGCKRLRGLNFRNETVIIKNEMEEERIKVDYGEICQRIKQRFIESIENPYRLIDSQISIKYAFE